MPKNSNYNRAYDLLEGMGEAMLSLARKHSTPQQWASWLKVPLQGAASEGDLTTVSALLKAGAASCGERERDGQTPLHAAAEGGSLEVVQALLRVKARRDLNKLTRGPLRQSPLFVATKQGHTKVALALVQAGAQVDLQDGNGWTPLMRAAADGNDELTNNLLLGGASANSRSKKGSQALHLAVQNGHTGVVRVLLKAGASPGARRKIDGKSAVDLAVAGAGGGPEVLRELLANAGGHSAAGGVEILDDAGLSAMGLAAREGRAWAINALVDAGADPDDSNDDQETPLHLACLHVRGDSVKALLRRGADETLCNDEFEVPEDVVGHCVPEEGRDEEAVEWIHEMLARAPADRVWRRRGWLAMLSARRRRSLEQKAPTHQNEQRLIQQQQLEQSRQRHCDTSPYDWEAEQQQPSLSAPEAASKRRRGKRRRLIGGGVDQAELREGEGEQDGGSPDMADSPEERVHPSLKKFHWTVIKMVDEADELIFRRIVSYL